ncbi:TetR/AcrR family transcriptional regulator [Flavobacteriaceae bacterium F08102]|nr:TetR/AcrR family transcriptional regulator [Flavobacteriaceae bacterium F08102]
MQQELKSELTKKVIIDKAFALFYENGFKSTSINSIMKEATLSKGAFYHHYQNKKEIALEVIEQKLKERVYDSMILPLYQPGNPLEILENIFINRIKSFPLYMKQHGCPLNNLINEIGDTEIAYQKALKSIIEKWKMGLVNLIERGKKDHCIKKEVSSHAVAIYLISAFEGVRGIRKLYEDDTVFDAYITALSHYLEQLKA